MSVIPSSDDTGFLIGLLIVVIFVVLFVFCALAIALCFVLLAAYKMLEYFWYELRRTHSFLGSPGQLLWTLVKESLGSSEPSLDPEGDEAAAVELQHLQPHQQPTE